MTAYNVVRFRVKPGRDEEFIEAHRRTEEHLPGFRHGSIIRTGDRSYCFIGEWDNAADPLNAENKMISILDRFRDTLEDLGGGLGLTDPVSGEVILEIEPR